MSDTPMMQQYKEIKSGHPDKILFFRLGDFYEMFFEDAIEASKILEITLTSRGKQENQEIPMCGIPYHSATTYIGKLVEFGKSVAICEQVEDPKTTKGIVKREITRIITPGTISDLESLEHKTHNFLLAFHKLEQEFFISYLDIGIGDVFHTTFREDSNKLKDELLRIRPAEIITFFPNVIEELELDLFYSVQIQKIDLISEAYQITEEQFPVSKNNPAVSFLLTYVSETQKTDFSFVNRVESYQVESYMAIDYNSVRNLELFETMRTKEKRGSLYWLLDKTKTAMGRRLLKEWIGHPLMSLAEIAYRQDLISYFLEERIEAENLSKIIEEIYDLERLASKSALLQATPKDYEALKRSINGLPELKLILSQAKQFEICNISERLDVLSDVFLFLDERIQENPPHILRDGGFICPFCDQELSEYYDAIQNGQSWLMELEEKEREKTQIKNLKIKYNKVFGYHIEVSKGQLDKVPDYYIRKQTIANGERYVTEELKEIEKKILTAKENSIKRELEIYEVLRQFVLENVSRIRKTAKIIAELDVFLSLSKVAYAHNYVRPSLSEDGIIEIREGRHPVVEVFLKNNRFIENDVLLNDSNQRFLIITGPNMSGKSTYLRQTALICLMAQIGSFVPAKEAHLSLIDRIFTRVGASDDLGSGQSTFMLEMSEMAYIINHYTEKSLLIVDEIGRGTSTYDGLSIAWSIVEYIANIRKKGKTLFATHYQELTELESKLEGVLNYKISVLEEDGKIQFLRKIERGSADKSYGIEVARLAGLPREILERATQILASLEKQDTTKTYSFIEESGQLSLLNSNQEEILAKKKTPYVTKNKNENCEDDLLYTSLRNFDLMNSTPLDCMQFINSLKKKIGG